MNRAEDDNDNPPQGYVVMGVDGVASKARLYFGAGDFRGGIGEDAGSPWIGENTVSSHAAKQ